MNQLRFSMPPLGFALLISLLLIGCSDPEDANVPEPESPVPAVAEEQLISALEEIAEQPLRSEENARSVFRLPYTTYQVVSLISRLSGEFSVLKAAVETAGLADALNGRDALTVFAPTNAAFAALGWDEQAVQALDVETLVDILTYHVTPGDRFTGDLLRENTISMLNGGTAEVIRKGRKLFINEARLFTPFLVNLPTRNGVIHIIDGVLQSGNDGNTITGPAVVGLAYAPVDSVTAAANALNQILTANPNIGVVARVDHSANAASVGLELPPTEVILFGNPNLGTPLMQINQTVGIDLPQKVLFYENESGESYAVYNTPTYLASRHGISADSATLPMIGTALQGLVTNASGSAVVLPDSAKVPLRAGLVVTASAYDAKTTYHRLREAVDAIAPLRIIAEVDHAANARRVGLELRPTKLLIFGNPNLGTPLMQAQPTVGIDLPQKMLVWEGPDHQVYVAYNDPYYVAQRHGISPDQAQLVTIAEALRGLVKQATE
ncbi:MAG: DUF302 domain-containing protein [Tunicatimonas sp.]